MEQWERNWQDYYKILQVDPSAEHEAIEAVYKRLSRKYHPDTNHGNPTAHKKMIDLNEAYEVLGNPERRKRYDEEWRRRRGRGEKKDASSPPKPKPVVEPTNISFKDVSLGEIQNASFVILNNGGPCEKVLVSNPDSWVKVVTTTRLDPPQKLPLRVEIEAEGKDWEKTYTEYIKIKLNEEETQISITLQTKPKPVNTSSRSKRIVVTLLLVIITIGVFAWYKIMVKIKAIDNSSKVVEKTKTEKPITQTVPTPRAPALLGSYDTPSYANGVYVQGKVVYR